MPDAATSGVTHSDEECKAPVPVVLSTASEPAAAADDSESEPLTMEFPKSVPMQYKYRLGDAFNVRKCYAKYYDMVLEHLKSGTETITITGTSGEAATSVALPSSGASCPPIMGYHT